MACMHVLVVHSIIFLDWKEKVADWTILNYGKSSIASIILIIVLINLALFLREPENWLKHQLELDT